jgi:hypothetical protein
MLNLTNLYDYNTIKWMTTTIKMVLFFKKVKWRALKTNGFIRSLVHKLMPWFKVHPFFLAWLMRSFNGVQKTTTMWPKFEELFLEELKEVFCDAFIICIFENVSSKLCMICRVLHRWPQWNGGSFSNYQWTYWCNSILLRHGAHVFVIICNLP